MFTISIEKIMGANPDNLIRLAKSLGIDSPTNLKHETLAKIIHAEIHKPREKSADEKADYISAWENFPT